MLKKLDFFCQKDGFRKYPGNWSNLSSVENHTENVSNTGFDVVDWQSSVRIKKTPLLF